MRLHYEMRGTGPDVVLLHGNNASLTDFEATGLMQRLARSHRVIAVDRPRLWTQQSAARPPQDAIGPGSRHSLGTHAGGH